MTLGQGEHGRRDSAHPVRTETESEADGMPIGRTAWAWLRAHWASAGKGTRGLLAALAIVGALIYVVIPLWYDAPYWLIPRLAGDRINRAGRVGISVVVAVAVIAFFRLSASTPASVHAVAPSPLPAGLVAQAPSQSPVASTPVRATAAPGASPAATITALSASDVARVKQILTANLNHYREGFSDGKHALGTERYLDAFAGLAAMQDPTSGAARFSAWRTRSRLEYDTSYLDAFGRADAFYSADNEPSMISEFMTDSDDARVAISDWADVAVAWQIHEATGAQLAAAESKVNDAFAKVERTIEAIVAAS